MMSSREVTLPRAVLSRAAVPAMAGLLALYVRAVQRYRFSDVRELRRLYAELVSKGRPVVICANHLTMVDSLLIHFALQPAEGYVLHYERLSWNVPAIENVHKHWAFWLLCYLGKTVPIDRRGSVEHHALVLERLRDLLLRAEPVTMFPEGTRSRSGRVEVSDVRYGIGKLLQSVPAPIVLCLYLRGRRQEAWGFAPEKGDHIDVRWRVLEPSTTQSSLRGARELSRQVIECLCAMEQEYFAANNEAGARSGCR